jgi:hypothetical protein
LIRFIESLLYIALQADETSVQPEARFTEVVVERDAPATEIQQRGLDLRAVAMLQIGEQCLAETAKRGAHLHQMTAWSVRARSLELDGDLAEIRSHTGVHDRNVCLRRKGSAITAHRRDVMEGTWMRHGV